MDTSSKLSPSAGQPNASNTGQIAASIPEWDTFLERTPLGQFQQSTKWARLKARDGWNAHSIPVDPSDPAAGGLQLLWKRTKFGNIGYVSKGPVLREETPESVDLMLARLKDYASSRGLLALILQPPNVSHIGEVELKQHGFELKPVSFVIRSTAMIDLSGGKEVILKRMNQNVRREVKLARQQGVTIRFAGREDIPSFFDLMLASCRRQGVTPNPSRPELLEALWDAFQPNVWLGLASLNGQLTSGVLMIGHGRRMTIWKKGWNMLAKNSYANCLLNVEAICHAQDLGYSSVDFAGVDPQIAETLIAGKELSPEQSRSRDVFHLRLGAVPYMVPPARLLIINPIFRAAFRLACKMPPLENWLMRKTGVS
jgi:lipid II:glycine glycyltransferase (peptidoglycan interpeptide bridge formation enzyme)